MVLKLTFSWIQITAVCKNFLPLQFVLCLFICFLPFSTQSVFIWHYFVLSFLHANIHNLVLCLTQRIKSILQLYPCSFLHLRLLFQLKSTLCHNAFPFPLLSPALWYCCCNTFFAHQSSGLCISHHTPRHMFESRLTKATSISPEPPAVLGSIDPPTVEIVLLIETLLHAKWDCP